MKTKLLYLVLILSVLSGCATTYKPQPIIISDLTRTPNVTWLGPLGLYAETYESNTGIDIRKAGLHGVLLTIQVVREPDALKKLQDTYQFDYGDIIGIGTEQYMPYPLSDALTKMINSETLNESIGGAAFGIATGAGIGAAAGTALGAILGARGEGLGIFAGAGAVYGALPGGVVGWRKYKQALEDALFTEVSSRSLELPFTVTNQMSGVVWFPSDVHSIQVSVDGNITSVPVISRPQ